MIWIVGNKGRLGTELINSISKSNLEFISSGRDVDISNFSTLLRYASGNNIDWIVNCAAYTSVDEAEDPGQLDSCRRANTVGPSNLARIASTIGAKCLHISSDHVFGSPHSHPSSEEDPVSPANVYARTKAEGEAYVRAYCPEHVILRTAWLYGKKAPNFVYSMLGLMRQKDRIGVVTDQVSTPTYAADLAFAVMSIVRAPKISFGTYHYTDLGKASRYEFALEIYRRGREYGLLERDCDIVPITTEQYASHAKRPAYSVLSTEKIQRDYHLLIPDWRYSLSSFLKSVSIDTIR